jgi:hypothetical protein
MTTDNLITAAFVTIAIGLFRLVEWSVKRRNGVDRYGMTEKEHSALMRLDLLHAPKDTDGIPLWYVPRSWAGMQKEIAESCRQISHQQERIADTLSRMEKNNDTHGPG